MKLALYVSGAKKAKEAAKQLKEKVDFCSTAHADVVVALGGDGHLLKVAHEMLSGEKKPIFGLNSGSIGFLMNDLHLKDNPTQTLNERIETARRVNIHPLKMYATRHKGEPIDALALNEVALCRASHQTAKFEIIVNQTVQLEELICDGVIAATPMGSTAYNLSAHGPILPLRSQSIALTPISAFRPRRWKGAILDAQDTITINVREKNKRPVYVAADGHVFSDIKQVQIKEDTSKAVTLMFDAHYSLEDRLVKEQFAV